MLSANFQIKNIRQSHTLNLTGQADINCNFVVHYLKSCFPTKPLSSSSLPQTHTSFSLYKLLKVKSFSNTKTQN